MAFDPTGLIIGSALSLFGGSKSSSAAREQAEMQNAAAERQLEYDTELWNMNWDKINADRDFAVNEVEVAARNEGRSAAYQDAVNLARYNRELQIRNREQESLNAQYLRSNDIYDSQITLNAITARHAERNELAKLDEIRAESAFDRQKLNIEAIKAEGTARSRGMTGRSAKKQFQAIKADTGQKEAAIEESLNAADSNTRAILEEISRDKTSADLAAWANKMLHPGTLPAPIVPFKTPMAEFLYPRELEPFDKGPEPVLGATASPSAAANQVWGSTITGIASGFMAADWS